MIIVVELMKFERPAWYLVSGTRSACSRRVHAFISSSTFMRYHKLLSIYLRACTAPLAYPSSFHFHTNLFSSLESDTSCPPFPPTILHLGFFYLNLRNLTATLIPNWVPVLLEERERCDFYAERKKKPIKMSRDHRARLAS